MLELYVVNDAFCFLRIFKAYIIILHRLINLRNLILIDFLNYNYQMCVLILQIDKKLESSILDAMRRKFNSLSISKRLTGKTAEIT